MKKFIIMVAFAAASGLAAMNSSVLALPSDPCSLVPSTQVASIIGPFPRPGGRQ